MATTTKKATTKKATAASEPVTQAPAASPDVEPAGVASAGVVASAGGEKQKLVRDSFTMPKPEYALLDAMKQRLLRRSKAVKKSELLRAGVATLAAMSDDALLATMDRVASIKTGRPRKQKAAAKTSADR